MSESENGAVNQWIPMQIMKFEGAEIQNRVLFFSNVVN